VSLGGSRTIEGGVAWNKDGEVYYYETTSTGIITNVSESSYGVYGVYPDMPSIADFEGEGYQYGFSLSPPKSSLPGIGYNVVEANGYKGDEYVFSNGKSIFTADGSVYYTETKVYPLNTLAENKLTSIEKNKIISGLYKVIDVYNNINGDLKNQITELKNDLKQQQKLFRDAIEKTPNSESLKASLKATEKSYKQQIKEKEKEIEFNNKLIFELLEKINKINEINSSEKLKKIE